MSAASSWRPGSTSRINVVLLGTKVEFLRARHESWVMGERVRLNDGPIQCYCREDVVRVHVCNLGILLLFSVFCAERPVALLLDGRAGEIDCLDEIGGRA